MKLSDCPLEAFLEVSILALRKGIIMSHVTLNSDTYDCIANALGSKIWRDESGDMQLQISCLGGNSYTMKIRRQK